MSVMAQAGWGGEPQRTPESPAAEQSVALAQATLRRLKGALWLCELAGALGTTVQMPLRKCSIKGILSLEVPGWLPTAQQSLSLTQVTPSSTSLPPAALASIFQAVPS